MNHVTLAGVLAGAVGLSACGGEPAANPPKPAATHMAHGLSVQLPAGWRAARGSLTPHLVDPREELSVGTFRLRYRRGRCAQVPSGTLERLGPRDAFITLQERGLDPHSTWPDFPPRPARFGPRLGSPSEVSECVPDRQFTDYLFSFTDGGRHFHALVVFGLRASPAVRAQAWGILDSLKVNPRVRPDWPATP